MVVAQSPAVPVATENSTAVADSTEALRLNRTVIIGNKKTLDRIILRELSLKPGDTIGRKNLAKVLVLDKNKIYNLRIFNTVDLRVLELPDKSFDLLVEVEERWFAFPIPIFELSDRNFNEWWENYDHKFNRVNYGLRWYQYNFRGRNESIRLTAQFGFSRKFDLTYRIPYLDRKQKQGLIFVMTYSEPKNLAYATSNHILQFQSGRETLRKRLGLGVTYTYRKSFYETHGISLEYSNGTIADTIQSLNENYYINGAASQQYASISYRFVAEYRDVIAYPLNGYQVVAGLDHRGFGFGQGVLQTSIYGSLAFHKPIAKNLYFSNFTSLFAAAPSAQPYSLFYGLGYEQKFVKGYEVYVIEGPYHGLNKSTLKTRLFQRTYKLALLPWKQFQHLPIGLYFKAHTDFGYVNNFPYYADRNLNTTLTGRLLMGVGVGFDLIGSYDSVFRFEYTLNREGSHGFFFHLKKEF
jgi:outer membrane protein assembly factor BamA